MKGVPPSKPSYSLVRRTKHGFTAATIGFVYWLSFSMLFAVDEPWDGLHYWSAAYPLSLLIAAALGFAVRRDAVIIGLSLTLAQIPVMLLYTTFETSLAMAAFFLCGLSIPAALAAQLGTTLRLRAT